MKPKALILFATGTNRDQDLAAAFELSGAEPVIHPVIRLREKRLNWSDYQLLAIPGGFSYADALGAGKLLALDLATYFSDEVKSFIDTGKPVIGICNGFQALVKSGILPEPLTDAPTGRSTLTYNAGRHFECRWVSLNAASKSCLWTQELKEIIDCPVAHGEGNFQVENPSLAQYLLENDQVAFVYAHPDGQPANGAYPANPNGSVLDIAGICNRKGNVLGLMPHPEDHIFPFQTPDRFRRTGHLGLALFKNGVHYVNGFSGG